MSTCYMMLWIPYLAWAIAGADRGVLRLEPGRTLSAIIVLLQLEERKIFVLVLPSNVAPARTAELMS
jgi:hypothetical protein